MDRDERMKLVIDGNAVYEVDQECMSKGLNREEKAKKDDSDKNSRNKKRMFKRF